MQSTASFVGCFRTRWPNAGAERSVELLQAKARLLGAGGRTVALLAGRAAIALAARPWQRARGPAALIDDAGDGFAFVDGDLHEQRGLRETLGAAATATPAEIVAAARRRWGEAFMQHLYGDYAVISWSGRGPLLCAVSPGGGRWLYYRHDDDGGIVWFADHPRLLLASDQPRADRSFFASALQGYFGGARTPFEGVARLRPGYALRAGEEGTGELRWWCVPPPGSVRLADVASYRAELRARLTGAVARHMRGHARVCVALSAGVDSGAVAVCAAEVARATGTELLALTYAPRDQPLADESPAAAKAAARIGIAHRVVSDEPAGQDAGSRLLEHAGRLPFPTGHLVFTEPLRALASAAAQWGASTLLNGAGGELHSGSLAYLIDLHGARRWGRLGAEVVAWLRRGMSPSRMALYVLASLRARGALGTHRDERKPWLRLAATQAPTDPDTHPMLRELERFLTQEAVGTELHHALYADHGVASCAPHLDRGVIELALGMPLELRMTARAGELDKPLLRASFPEVSDAICLEGAHAELGEVAARRWIDSSRDIELGKLFAQPSPWMDDVLDRRAVLEEEAMLRQSSEEMRSSELIGAALWTEAMRRQGIELS